MKDQMRVAVCFITTLLLSVSVASGATVHFIGPYSDGSGILYGPYAGTIDGSDAIVYCNDKANNVFYGQTWEANLTPLSTTANLNLTRYGSLSDAHTQYLQAAWLTTQYGIHPEAAYDIQYTIWRLFTNSSPKPRTDFWKKAAEEAYTSILPNQFSIVTNVGPVRPTGQIQEFLTLTPIPAGPVNGETPEPGTLLLGLVGGGIIVVARMKSLRRCSKT